MGAFNPGPPSYFSPYRMPNIPDGPEGEYITDRITDEAMKYIEQNKDKPFMLCLWHFAVHGPWGRKEEMVGKYRDKTDPRGRQNCPTMGAMFESMDENIGRVLDHLEKLGLAENTIVIFTSDNGGNIHSVVDGVAPTNNYPLRSGKGNIHEGGVRVPCIISWPGAVEQGSECSEAINSIDFYPTLLEMAGIVPNQEQHLDGVSLVPLLKGESKLNREAIFNHFPHYVPALNNIPGTSARKGDWKLYRFYGEGENLTPVHTLYNLKADIGETWNLAGEMPDLVNSLGALIDAHIKDIDGVIPIPNPSYDPNAQQPKKSERGTE
jgi:arylsulfatase A-like enzyme